MAKKPNAKRAARIEKNNRNMNRATVLVLAGFLAEMYLIVINRLYVNGTIHQVATSMRFLEAMRWIGLAAAVVGGVLLALGEKREAAAKGRVWLVRLGGVLLGCGLFFALSSFLMVSVYPQGTRAVCVAVPVVVLLGIVFLLYPHEFSVQAVGLAASLAALFLLMRGLSKPYWRTIVTLAAVLVLLLLAVLALCSYQIRRSGGVLTLGKRKLSVYNNERTNYTLLYVVLAVCFAAVLLGMLVSGAAFYGLWALALLTFALAVYYTVKMM